MNNNINKIKQQIFISCCEITAILTNLNQSIDKSEPQDKVNQKEWKAIVGLVWETLDSQKKLCSNCYQEK